ncbi:MAG TPA: response regulator [Bacteroidia bacterium]|jgi:two-component system response regulator AtoC|nr:response regulator [Bacteroidia bacterium]
MTIQALNIFIVDDNKAAGIELKKYLWDKFGDRVEITAFTDGKSCLEEVESDTHLVIITCSPSDEKGLLILKSIKAASPATEVIMLVERESIVLAIESYKAGAKELVVKENGSEKKLSYLIRRIVMAPIRIIVKELGLSQRLAIFFMSFITVGIIVGIALYFK